MKKNAFTLVEILTVIVIFGVGILAILKLLTNSIGYFDTINMQTRATLLAKEALDLTFHHRDSNILQGYPRNFYPDKEENEQYWQAGSSFKISLKEKEDKNSYISLTSIQQPEKTEEKSDFDQHFETFALEIGDDGLYKYREEKTIGENQIPNKGFARWISFDAVKGENGETVVSEKILKVSSHVLYKRGGTTGEVVLESLIGVKDGSIAETLTENETQNSPDNDNETENE